MAAHTFRARGYQNKKNAFACDKMCKHVRTTIFCASDCDDLGEIYKRACECLCVRSQVEVQVVKAFGAESSSNNSGNSR